MIPYCTSSTVLNNGGYDTSRNSSYCTGSHWSLDFALAIAYISLFLARMPHYPHSQRDSRSVPHPYRKCQMRVLGIWPFLIYHPCCGYQVFHQDRLSVLDPSNVIDCGFLQRWVDVQQG